MNPWKLATLTGASPTAEDPTIHIIALVLAFAVSLTILTLGRGRGDDDR